MRVPELDEPELDDEELRETDGLTEEALELLETVEPEPDDCRRPDDVP